MNSDYIVPGELTGPGGLKCPTDVIENSHLAFDRDFGAHLLHISGRGKPYIVTTPELIGYTQLSTSSRENLLGEFRGGGNKITPGSRLVFFESGRKFSGTLACFAYDRNGNLGILTNKHIGNDVDEWLYFPEDYGRHVATITNNIGEISANERFPGLLSNPVGSYEVDAGFATVEATVPHSDLDFRLPVLDADGSIDHITLGAPLPLDLDSMGLISEPVIGVGQMRSYQEGRIYAFAYEGHPMATESVDYLVVGSGEDEFSDPGDSGKLIVTKNGFQPVALLWGGDHKGPSREQRSVAEGMS